MGSVTKERIISELHLLEEKAKLLNIETLEVYLIGGGNGVPSIDIDFLARAEALGRSGRL